MITKTEFAARRKKLLAKLPENSIAILYSAPEVYRNNDTHYPYRQNSDFYYLTNFKEPHSVAVFIPKRAEGEFILFNRLKDPSKEVWTGAYAGQQGAIADFEADQAFPITELDSKILELLAGKNRLYYPIGQDDKRDAHVFNWVNQLKKQYRGAIAPTEFFDSGTLVHEMRLIKSEAEIALMRKAAQISSVAHIRAMKICREELHEYTLQAEIEHEFKKNNTVPAYGSIVGSGSNACTLHYVDNEAQLKKGELVLIDAACEHEYYAADITRTFPAGGQFSPEQRQIYELVLSIQLAIIEKIRPGLPYEKLQKTACELITAGLVNLGLLKGEISKLLEEKAYLPFYMHSSGHWLGLDVHDVGAYQVNGKSRLLEAGMVLTVEPGVYIAADNLQVDEKWRGIGVRIEDDILVTPTGYEVLSIDAPKIIRDIEVKCQP
jgi:Xaa-Pro aminopeptidase